MRELIGLVFALLAILLLFGSIIAWTWPRILVKKGKIPPSRREIFTLSRFWFTVFVSFSGVLLFKTNRTQPGQLTASEIEMLEVAATIRAMASEPASQMDQQICSDKQLRRKSKDCIKIEGTTKPKNP